MFTENVSVIEWLFGTERLLQVRRLSVKSNVGMAETISAFKPEMVGAGVGLKSNSAVVISLPMFPAPAKIMKLVHVVLVELSMVLVTAYVTLAVPVMSNAAPP